MHPYTFLYVRSYVCMYSWMMNAAMYFFFRACIDTWMHAYFYTAAFRMEKVKTAEPNLTRHENDINYCQMIIITSVII